jgi:hypothetical protein
MRRTFDFALTEDTGRIAIEQQSQQNLWGNGNTAFGLDRFTVDKSPRSPETA